MIGSRYAVDRLTNTWSPITEGTARLRSFAFVLYGDLRRGGDPRAAQGEGRGAGDAVPGEGAAIGSRPRTLGNYDDNGVLPVIREPDRRRSRPGGHGLRLIPGNAMDDAPIRSRHPVRRDGPDSGRGGWTKGCGDASSAGKTPERSALFTSGIQLASGRLFGRSFVGLQTRTPSAEEVRA